MAAVTISIAIQKGGCGKSTTSGVLAYMLSKKHRVLLVDMDGQGNATQLITGIDDLFEFGEKEKTAYDAMMALDATNYITKVTENIDALAGSELINTLSPFIYLEYRPKYKKTHDLLSKALEPVKDNYDYIIIDTPPALGELVYNSLAASDFVIPMFETSKFCYLSLKSFFETIDHVREHANPNLQVAGIFRTMIDKRRSDNAYYRDLVAKEYGDLVFESVMTRTAVIGRVPAYGLQDNPEINQVIKQYNPFFKELMSRVNVRRQNGEAQPARA